jgi:hypothetical protein
MTDLATFVKTAPLVDTHEHLYDEQSYLERGPDILQDLFQNYVHADLVVAGATPEAVERLTDASDPDIAARFAGVQQAWQHCQFTGYGEAVRSIAERVYGMETITLQKLEEAQQRHLGPRLPGERLRLLKDLGGFDHVQIDDMSWQCVPDASGPDFFLYDLSWMQFASGQLDLEMIESDVGIHITKLDELDAAMAALFAKYGPFAIAVKTQHAYDRTLLWRDCSPSTAAHVLAKHLEGRELSVEDRLCLGDWCLARGVELAIEHNLPFKIHTGYYAGHGRMPVDFIRPGNLCALLAAYPAARFVLMHAAYPYGSELIALAKHYPNVYLDLCWAWSIDPYRTVDFVRSFIHAVPNNKLFAFGGDTVWPHASLAYSWQARNWLSRALQAEVDEGMPEALAIGLAECFMRGNQLACFDVAGKRSTLVAAHKASQVE